eukprot:CAMPEP_0118663108 /NCGR_PEP_ID=MMETSP0785-20121206/17219_1 /TAXON_ID=91992 /ORGANISM="Bolidomonas pacifica, Strain CCMP 1866" /LENGTH=161 /DNA_ID=CAMNT_0006556757 /DNA_START=487 /DNA_END=969 /DNA_ORIENTATION=+
MDLPQCCSLFLLGKHEIPFGLGWGWYQEMDYETGGGLPVNSKKRRETFESAVSSVTSLLESFADISPLENVFLLSYASGADVAMEVASRITFGGCMCFRGGDSVKSSFKKTDVLQLLGRRDGRYSGTRAANKRVEQIHFDRDGQMGDSKEEVKELFKWLAP